MNKVKIILLGADYQDVSPEGKYKRWRFFPKDGIEANGKVIECIIMERKTLPSSQKPGDSYDMYVVIERHTKEPYVIFCNKVLADRLRAIPLNSAVRISFEGVPPGKKYHVYKVGVDASFRFDPNTYQLKSDYVETQNNTSTSNSTTNSGGAFNGATPQGDFEEPPF